ncbi:ABC transporter substrate-binding protein [Solicola gregarius]|uniref:Iron-siderophore ABC transporter substrate-binding protein n=1 Tax=Solicola gregarius TaxID=2908642 RepID=A0AA46YME9_9ACTN|nr:iron-siderophore ABC transporter substrate-binding protein [Solicola gregarius]UYM06461.1 iron-siderophore ABC transporter substrate-binding protein [Solicola gregarius]
MTHRLGATIAACLLLLGIAACGGLDDTSDSAARTRTVDTANGPVEVPERPERVVVLDTGELDDALALGVTPVGAVTTDVDSEFLGYLGDRTDGIEPVGTITEPNLEKIAALEPDVILSSKVRHEALYDQLSDIAPTVFSENVGYPWKQNFRLHAEALGLEGKAADLMAAYEAKAARVDKALPDDTVISLVRFVPDQTRLYSDKSFSGVITADVGAQVPEPARGADTFVELSPEKLGLADADYLLTSTYGAAEDTEQAAITKSGLWTNLDAVEDGRTGQIDDDLITGIGILAANEVLDSMDSAFAH